MLLSKIMFDEMNPNWNKSRERNIMFLKITEDYINRVIRCRGYRYLNQIHEDLGARWNPNDENPCIRNDGVDRIAFIQFELFDKLNNTCEIHIHRYD